MVNTIPRSFGSRSGGDEKGREQQTIGERFGKDQEMLLPLPAVLSEACDKRATRVTSMSLVRYRGKDYPVPVEWGHREVLVKAFVHEVVICEANEVIARHRRSDEREDMIFDPLHYLALLEQKTNAPDQAAPGAWANLRLKADRMPG